ncbi:MAG: metalloregulator ArsR/SmtB family transcription factor [Micrococcaceae bacterium]|nr:metalloregulator ArsR/SmtB family transcription factor [Micrococcaceae bacterium]MDN6179201.1 metalloregulator ArsR/SmtB family transcription factor [Micrococcaceae bacterium]
MSTSTTGRLDPGTGPASAATKPAPGCHTAPTRIPLAIGDAEVLSASFKALADPSRLRILSIVAADTNAETCVCDLSEPLQLGQPTVSHHLKILVDAGFLHREKRGVWAYYSLVPGALDHVAENLTGRIAPDGTH